MTAEGPAISQRWVLLHGLAREAGHWGDFPEVLRNELGPGHRVLMPNLLGSGRRWLERSPATVGEMVNAYQHWIREQEGSGPLHLLGLSLGGMIALEWACTAAHELASCTLINTSLAGVSPPWQRLRPGMALRLAWSLRPGSSRTQHEAAVLRAISADGGLHAQALNQWSLLAGVRPARTGSALRQLVAAVRYQAPAKAPSVPVLVVHSAGDKLVSPTCSSLIAQRWRLPLVTHPWAGHDLPLDDPHWLARVHSEWMHRRDTAESGTHGPLTVQAMPPA